MRREIRACSDYESAIWAKAGRKNHSSMSLPVKPVGSVSELANLRFGGQALPFHAQIVWGRCTLKI